MSHDKPSLPKPADPTFGQKVKQCLERIMGTRGGAVKQITGLEADVLTVAPDENDFNALRNDVERLRLTLNQLLSQVQAGHGE